MLRRKTTPTPEERTVNCKRNGSEDLAAAQLARTEEPLPYNIARQIATDALHESLLFLIKRRGTAAWRIPFWILSGGAIIMNRLAKALTEEGVATFPANDDIVALAERESSRGRSVILADRSRSLPRALRRGLRLHRWAKNALVFVPLILGGKAPDGAASMAR